ncbi:MAG TPA: winged helix-turn-helix domain-containing protein [Pyrinomonadaceae bacterium]|nr:winged helix-turn-helix domain-containing protein [Pyrinomonadaceae bacterium]
MSTPKLLKNRRLFEFGIFNLDTKEGLFADGKSVKLAPKVFQTLVFLVENQGRIISKEELFENVWTDTFVEDNALSFNISQLRKSLAAYDPQTVFVETIPKRGFRFSADVVETEANGENEIVYEKYRKQELIIEEIVSENSDDRSLSKPSESRSKFYLPIAIVCVSLIIFGFFFLQRQQTDESRLFDSLKSVKLTSWKSTRSNDYGENRSSHSGNMIAYSSTKEGNTGIFVKQINGGEEIRIAANEWDNFSPVWSPDDQQIAFVSVRDRQTGVYVCPSLGGTPILLKQIGEGNAALRGWSKDGATIFYEYKGNLFKLNIAGKEIGQITNFEPNAANDKFFSFSPSENKIAFCDKTDGQTDIWLMDISGENRKRLTNDADIETEISWHPDNNRLFYSVYRNKNFQINLAYADGRKPVQVTRGDSDLQLMNLSPDGTKLFYSILEDKSDIGANNIDSGEEVEAANETDSEFWSDISPDGRSIAYLSNSSKQAIKRLTDSVILVRPLAEKGKTISFQGSNQKWLTDSRRLAFLRYEEANQRYNLWTFDIANGEEKQITSNGVTAPGTASFPYNRTQIKDFDWSNDGKKFVYTGIKRQNIFLVSADNAETANLTNNADPSRIFHCPIWSADNSRIAVVSENKSINADGKAKWSVWLFENGQMKEIFSTSESLRFLGWSEANGKMLFESHEGAMLSDPIDIKLLEISTDGESKIVNSFGKISALTMVLSPDKKNVAFVKEEGGKDNIYLGAVNKKEVKKLTNNSYSYTLFGSLAWSPDGKTVYFDRQERVNTISMFEIFDKNQEKNYGN